MKELGPCDRCLSVRDVSLNIQEIREAALGRKGLTNGDAYEKKPPIS